MKFGKHIQADQVPGWSQYYLDYKFLKKIVSSLAANRPGSEAASLALGIRPADILNSTSASTPEQIWDPSIASNSPLLLSVIGRDEDKGSDFQAHKAAFFFKLERELEKINAFYLQKEAELKLRLETLLSKRRAAAMRTLPDSGDRNTLHLVEWNAVEEGLRLLERDLGKLQRFIEMNAIGFRKILKKWDKRSKSQTKELYLSRQVDVQPVFNRQLISELADTVAACLLDLTDLSRGLQYEVPAANDIIFTRRLFIERSTEMRPFHDLENSLRTAVETSDEAAVREIVRYSDTFTDQPGGRTNITRILWKAVIDSPPELADIILSIPINPFDFLFVDDINGRTCLHQVAMAGMLRLVNICLAKNVPADKTDIYGRSALHYAAMNGHSMVCRRLIEAKVPTNAVDMDNFTPLTHATLRGSVDCVRVLLREGDLEGRSEGPNLDLLPLSLASRAGHIDVALFLLQRGAENAPNCNGEFPIHLAAKEGHTDVTRLLVKHEGWDTPDKYTEWTPLFHAARHGHASCVEVLIEAGCQVNAVDEFGYLALHYAAWYGHHKCVSLLLNAAKEMSSNYQTPRSEISPPVAENQTEDVDMIPALSLPPPIMPYRVYGHNYLDKNSLVQISIGRDPIPSPSGSSNNPAVRLYPPFMGTEYQESYLQSSPLFKLVMTATPDASSAPYSILLPLGKAGVLFAFQASSLDCLSLEFALYPNFGTKTIGRAVALPTVLKNAQNGQLQDLPILDNRLHVIGDVSIGINVITPFQGVTLEIGGAVETYWKSTTVPALDTLKAWAPAPVATTSPASIHTSPSNQSATHGGHSFTFSSITGEYIYIIVQVTRDFYAVAYPYWKLPVDDFDICVSDVSLAQFEKLSEKLGRNLDQRSYLPSRPTDWYKLLQNSMVPLTQLLKLIPPTVGLCLELAYPLPAIRKAFSLANTRLDLNPVVDSLLRTIYRESSDYSSERRRIVFVSWSPDVCAALNWKQPNYPVFFASQCGRQSWNSPTSTSLSLREIDDQRLSSLASAVEFAKSNNLLGILLEADLLIKVPSLVVRIKDAGLLIMVWGDAEILASLASPDGELEGTTDAFLRNGVLSYLDHEKNRFC